MRDPGTMGVLQRLGDLHSVAQHLTERQRSARDPIRQRLSVEILHHQILEVVLAANVVERTDVRIGQCRDGPCFPLETSPKIAIRGDTCQQDLDRDDAIEACVAGPVDFPHPACAEWREQLMGSELRADREGQAVPAS